MTNNNWAAYCNKQFSTQWKFNFLNQISRVFDKIRTQDMDISESNSDDCIKLGAERNIFVYSIIIYNIHLLQYTSEVYCTVSSIFTVDIALLDKKVKLRCDEI